MRTDSIILALNKGDRGRIRLHFPTHEILVPGDLLPGFAYESVFYTDPVRRENFDFVLDVIEKSPLTAQAVALNL